MLCALLVIDKLEQDTRNGKGCPNNKKIKNKNFYFDNYI